MVQAHTQVPGPQEAERHYSEHVQLDSAENAEAPPRRRVTPKGHNDLLDIWREQVDQARRGQETSWSVGNVLAQESADAYEEFLESLFIYYAENAKAAEKGTKEG